MALLLKLPDLVYNTGQNQVEELAQITSGKDNPERESAWRAQDLGFGFILRTVPLRFRGLAATKVPKAHVSIMRQSLQSQCLACSQT